MTDDTLMDLSDDTVSIKANVEDLIGRLRPYLDRSSGFEETMLRGAICQLQGAIPHIEGASSYLDSIHIEAEAAALDVEARADEIRRRYRP